MSRSILLFTTLSLSLCVYGTHTRIFYYTKRSRFKTAKGECVCKDGIVRSRAIPKARAARRGRGWFINARVNFAGERKSWIQESAGGALKTYTDPESDKLLSSSLFAPISAVSPYRETEKPN